PARPAASRQVVHQPQPEQVRRDLQGRPGVEIAWQPGERQGIHRWCATIFDASGTILGSGSLMTLKTLIEAVNEALHEEMERDPSMIVLGEDVGVHGGVFRATDGLQKQFGADRVIDTPLAELGIIGVAIGAAMQGLRPVAEIQFADYIHPAYDQIVNEAAK